MNYSNHQKSKKLDFWELFFNLLRFSFFAKEKFAKLSKKTDLL